MLKTAAKCPFDLTSPKTYFDALPHDTLTELRNEAPVFWHDTPGGPGYWALLKYDDIRQVSLDNATFSSALKGVFYDDRQAALKGSLILSDPPDHRRLRQVVEGAFSSFALRNLEDYLRQTARRLMREAAERRECDFVYDLAAELPLGAISEIMQLPHGDRRDFLQMGDDIIRAADNGARNAAVSALGDYGRTLGATRKGDGDDLISKMLANEGGHPLTTAEFGGQFAQIAVAANETTRTLLSCTMLELIERPALYRELQENPALLDRAIEEFLRWATPIYYMRRTATRDTQIRGQTIRAGEAVVMYYLSANRDEEIFDRPFELDIRRSPNRHLAFGIGRHVCLGQFLARLEAKIFLEEFFKTFARVELAGKPQRLASNVTNSWDRIPVRLTPM